MNNPLVSISCITYNHAPYIRQCLDGFLMQECDFEYEILIHDDASTDGTSDIIREYQKKYPEIIKPIIQTENQYSKGIGSMMPRFNFPRAKGKYIALCEGDDYWTDPLKLQKQVDFLESNPDYVLCFHNCILLRDDKFTETILDKYDYKSNQEIPPMEFQNWIAQTATIVYRNNPKIPKLLSSFNHVVFGDVLFRRVIVDFGKVYLINEVMSVYRKHDGGITHKSFSNIERDKKKIEQFKEMKAYFGDKWLDNPIAKHYIFISLAYFNKKNVFLSVYNLFLAFKYNPRYTFKFFKATIIRRINKYVS